MNEIDIQLCPSEKTQDLENFLVLEDEAWRDLAKNYIRSMFSNDFRRPTFIIALEGGEIIGSAAFSEELFTVGVWGISWVNVRADKRNKGIGERLLRSCFGRISTLTDGKRVTVILATYPEKTGLYDKTGFRKCGLDADGGWIMTKTLSG